MIHVIGLGFVGLTTLLGFASKGFDVVGVETSSLRLNTLKNNKIPFKEPNLEKILRKQKNIIFSKKLIKLKNKNNFFFICVGTPNKKNGSQDLDQIFVAINNIVKSVKNICKNNIIIIKSTVLPGTINKLEKIYKSRNITFVSNPEFLREGHAWNDLIQADKIILGSNDIKAKKKLENMYKKFKGKVVQTNPITAEFSKYLSNSALSVMISFSNEITMIAEKFKNINIKQLFETFKLDKRWKNNSMSEYFHPGIGFGGYCLPKDTVALLRLSKKINFKSKILDSTIKINNLITKYQINKIRAKLKKDKKIVILGISFKALSDDLRNSIPIKIIKSLVKLNYKNIYIHDPFIKNLKIENLNLGVKKIDKLVEDKKTTYILMNQWPLYLKFLKKIDKARIIDLRYTI